MPHQIFTFELRINKDIWYSEASVDGTWTLITENKK